MTVVDADAALEQVQRPELADVHLARIREAISGYRAARSAGALRHDAVYSLIATLVFAAAIVVLVWFWRWIDRLTMRRVAHMHGVEIHSFEVMRAGQIASGLRRAL